MNMPMASHHALTDSSWADAIVRIRIHASAGLGPHRRRCVRRPEECEPASHRTVVGQRPGGRSRLRFAPDPRGDCRARRSVRHLDPVERRPRDPHGRAGGGAGHAPARGPVESLMALRTLPQALAQGAEADAGYCFVTADGDRRRSYADLQQAARRTAGSLRAAGLRRGDLVGLVLPDAEQFLTTLFGASIAGLIPASIYPPSTTSDLPRYFELTAAILRASGARAVVTSRALAASFEDVRRLCPDLSQILCIESFDGPAM